MFKPACSLCLTVAVVVYALICSSIGASSELSISLPAWAVELNTASSIQDDVVQHHDESLVEWASRPSRHDPPRRSHASANVFLVVGAKSSVLHGFQRRQAIRQTWAHAHFVPNGVHIVFLGCRPDLLMLPPEKQQQVYDAIELEKRVFGDLLTTELRGCEDSYAGLSDKTKAFMHWAATTHPSLAYVMEVDDDVYLRLDRVVALLQRSETPRMRFLAGNSASTEYRVLGTPFRDPRHKYYVSAHAYPMNTFPPYVSGQHFILSSDLVRFLSRNVDQLRGHGGCDDMAVGLWLFAMLRIKVTYVDEFEALRYIGRCSDACISLADLSVQGIRFIHKNIAQGSRLCDKFGFSQWTKTPRVVSTHSGDDGVQLHWKYQLNGSNYHLDIAGQLTVGTSSVDFVYVPSATIAEEGFCGQTASLLHERLYYTSGDGLCCHHTSLLLTGLDQTVGQFPAQAPALNIARHNLKRMQISDRGYDLQSVSADETYESFSPAKRPFVTVILSASSQLYRVLIECLLVELHPDKQVLVLNDDQASRIRHRIDGFVVTSLDRSNLMDLAVARAKIVFLIEMHASNVIERYFTNPRVVIFSPGVHKSSRLLSIPMASFAFATTIKYTPTTLLQPTADVMKRHEILHILADSGPSTRLTEFLDVLQEILPSTPTPIHTIVEYDRFGLDKAVQALKNAKFVIVFAENDVSDRLVMAFLAGAIPIVVGNGSATSPLFNTKAYINCGSFETLHNCAAYVADIDTSPDLYAQMHNVPPIGYLRMFEEVFSWHPEVLNVMNTRNKSTGATKMSERLRLILSKPSVGG